MDRIRNPFNPGSGAFPPVLSGRNSIIEDADVVLERAKKDKPCKSMMIMGLRGVGKTVLLKQIAKNALNQKYKVKEFEVSDSESFLDLFSYSIKNILLEYYNKSTVGAVTKALSALKNFVKFNIKYEDFSINVELDPTFGCADSGKLELDMSSLLVLAGKVAKERDSGIAFIIDEMQLLKKEELKALVYSIQQIQSEALPVVFIGAGLPNLIDVISNSKTYAERAFDIIALRPLNYEDSCSAISIPMINEGVIIEQDALDYIYELTNGYPYFLQEWGSNIWRYAENSPITYSDVYNITPLIIERLDNSFFTMRFNRLTEKEKDFLYGMAKVNEFPCKISCIVNNLEMSKQSMFQLRTSLIKKGMIYTPKPGYLNFTVPLFSNFMIRIMEDPGMIEEEIFRLGR